MAKTDSFRVHKIVFHQGCAPDLAGGAYSLPQTPELVQGGVWEVWERGVKEGKGRESEWKVPPACL